MARGIILYRILNLLIFSHQNIVKVLFVLINTFICQTATASENNSADINTPWQLWRNKDEVKIEYRPVRQDQFIEIKASTTIESSLSGFLLFIEDANNIPNWLANASSSQFLKKISATENIFRTEFKGFWPIQTRDIIIHSKYRQNEDFSVDIFTLDAGDFQKPYANIIRVELISGHWLIKPIYNAIPRVHVAYTFVVDAKGNIPLWLNKKLALKGIWETMQNIKQQLPKSAWQTKKHIAIKEPTYG